MKKYIPEILSFVLLALGIWLRSHATDLFPFQGAELLYFLIAFLPVGVPVVKEAWECICEKEFFNEFTLMVLASIGAFYIGEYPEGVAVMLFYSVGEKLQDGAVSRARGHIRSLLDVRPETARVVSADGQTDERSPEAVRPGDTVEVRPGERVPLDGVLLTPHATFDTAALTGESMPRLIERDGEVLAAVSEGPAQPVVNPDGTLQRDEVTGEIILMPGEVQPTVVPAYSPGSYPLVLRRNVRLFGQLLGASDVDAVEDQQVAINKYGTKIQEKLLKGGSYVTLPQGVNIETTDRELKIIRLKNPADKALISVLNIQPDTSRDQQMLEVNYSWAKSTLGITDAFQGKYDASATSGTAKQFSANQSAGRLQSKREMKNQAYARLYKLMFQFMLAYADEPYPMTLRGPDGTVEYVHFDRYEFLKRDAAGQLYWNDEFLFDVDPASNLAANRETLWTMIDQKYQAGAFGPLGETASLYRLWTLLAETGYPHAEAMKASVGQQLEKEQGGQAQESALPGKGGSAL